MTTLSRILVDPRSRGARALIGNPQAMHAAVMAAFGELSPGDGARPLWRLDPHGGGFALYLSGPGTPDLTGLLRQMDLTEAAARNASMEPFLSRLGAGQTWTFRLTANPVMSVSQGEGKRGKVVPHVTVAQQMTWLEAKSHQHGFRIETTDDGDGPDAAVTERRDLVFFKGTPGSASSRKVSLRTARFDGRLQITDADLIRNALTQGIGRARAYGCGLMSLAPVGSV